MPYAILPDRLVIAITGDDRIPFLQGLITNDAARLEKGEAIYAAMLSPQGKFLHDFFIIPDGETLLLDVNRDRADDLLKRLKIYKLRASVTLEPVPEMTVHALWNAPAPAHSIVITDPRLAALGLRIYGTTALEGEPGDYEAHRIALTIPDGAKDMHIEKSLLLEFSFESLHGVSFSKGCYVGQEVTARSKFRGQVRKCLVAIRAEHPLPAGGDIVSGGVAVGELLSTHGTHGLALLRVEALQPGTILQAGDVTITAEIPHWASESPIPNP